MNSFLKSYLAALLAAFTLIGIGFLFLIAAGASGKDNSIANESILRIQLSGEMRDFVPRSDFSVFGELFGTTYLSMEEIVFNIEKATSDDRIQSIYLELGTFSAGTPQLKEIREALKQFQAEGKEVYAYASIMSRQSYYLGSAADHLWLSPTGVMEWTGLASSYTYMKGAFDKLGVKINLIRGSDNAYKSAGEPFIAETMSEANREQISSYLNSAWQSTLADLEADGRVSAAFLDAIADSGILIRPEEALSYGMVDELLYEDEMMERLNWVNDDDNNFVSLRRYNRELNQDRTSIDRVAVIYAEGNVVLGKSDMENMGSSTIVEALRAVRNEDRIKAVVLRVNSPGGVSLAGDAMWREVQLLREVKPVVVSMGNVAASAGYQISAPADTIMAYPQTITGSIGVFMMFPTASKLMREELGISLQTVKTNEFGDFGSFDRELTPAEYNELQQNVDHFYDHFKNQVAEGRALDRTFVDSIARGRVWTGEQAMGNGLVDLEGGLLDAIRVAAEMGGIDGTPGVSSYPILEDPLTELLNSMSAEQAESEMENQLGPLAPVYQEWKEVQAMFGMQKRLVEYNMNQPL